MSEEELQQQVENEEQILIANDEVAQEVVVADGAEPIEDDEDIPEGEDEVLEIDMSNNSWTYFDKHTDSVFTVFTHPKLPLVVTGGGDNSAYMWTSHCQPPKFAAQVKHNESVIAGGFTADGDYMVTGDMSGKISVHKAFKKGQEWRPFGELQETEEIAWIKVHPTQPVFAFGGADGSVWVYQITPSLEQIMSGFNHQQDCTGGEFINVNDLDNLALVTMSIDGSIIGWNCYTATAAFKIGTHELKGLTPPWVSMAKSPNDLIAVGSNNGLFTVINPATGAVLSSWLVKELKEEDEELDASIESISFCETAPLAACGLVCGDVLIYETKSWRLRHRITLEDSATKVLFVGGQLFASCINGKVYKWDALTGEELFVGVGHNMGILDFAVIENGHKIITAGDEGVSLVFVTEK